MKETLRVLFVEDNRVDQMAFKRFVKREKLHYDFEICGSVAEASNALRTELFDIVLTDHSLGDGTAFELFDDVGDVPLIIITGSGNEEIAVKAMSAGAVDYLIKDPNSNYLVPLPNIINSAIDHKRAEDALIQYQKNLEKMVRERTSEISKTNKMLRQSEEKYRLLVENIYDIVWQTDLKLVFTYVSPSIESTFGYTVDEWIGTKLSQHASTKAFFQMARKALFSIKHHKEFDRITFQSEMLRKDGTEIPVEITGKMLYNKKGIPVGLQGTTVDITERVQAREALNRRNRELTLLNRVIAAASTTLEPEAVLETTCRELALSFDLPQAAAALLNEERTSSVVVAEYLTKGYTSAMGIEIPVDSNPVMKYIFENKAPLVITDAQKDPRMAVIQEEIQQRGTVSMLILPLMAQGRVVGTLGLDSVERREFSSEEVDLAANVVRTAARALENAQLFSQAKRRLKRIEALHNIDKIISSSIDLNLTSNLFLKQAQIQLEVDAADILLFDPLTLNLKCIGRTGFKTSALKYTDLRLGQGLAGQVAQQREIKHIPDLLEEKKLFQTSPEMSGEGFITYYGIPLIVKGVLKGVMEIFHRGPLSLDSEWLMFSNALAGLAAIAIDNASMFNDLQRSIMDLNIAYDSTLEGWAKTLELRDYETEGHSRRVVEMTVKLAGSMGLPADQIIQIRRGALLHDIGKMGIPDSILQKPGKLTDDEWEIMRQHPVYAFNTLSGIEFLRPALEIPHYHHERWDGNGYPQGLKGEEIPLAARIFAIVDVWDALNSDRPYRKAWSKEKTLAHIKEQSEKHFDPRVVNAFLKIIELN